MAAPRVILFDLASQGKNACWSYNPWKTRLLLNYKNIPYETQWMDYPDLAPFFTSKGLLPNGTGTSAYTIPTITLDGVYTMDSRKIATALETSFPTPSARLDHPKLAQVEALILPCMHPLVAVVVPRVARTCLADRSVEYFRRTRAERFGMSLEELEAERGGDAAFEAAREKWGEMAALVEGPFVLGEEVSYADFVIVSALEFARRAGGGTFERMVGMFPVFGRMHEGCKPWLERDDH